MSDPNNLQSLIDKFAEENVGLQYEEKRRELKQCDSAYSFLFGGFGCRYYYYKRWFSTQFSASRPSHDHQQVFLGHSSDPLPADVAEELYSVIDSLNGTKASIRSAKAWFMEKTVFASALAECLRDKVLSLGDSDSERQMHLVFLVTDILFQSFNKRSNPIDLDYEAFVFKPVLGSMLAKIYLNPQNKEINQSRLQNILEFLESKEIYDKKTIDALETEMIGGGANLSATAGRPTEVRIQMHDDKLGNGKWV